jgi:hypothetical protein
VFTSTSTDVAVGDTNGFADVFMRDCVTGITEIVSVSTSGVQGNANSGLHENNGVLDVSSDGRYVVFESRATNLVANDTNNSGDVFLRDRLLGTTERVSITWDGSQGNNNSFSGSISDDGRYVTFGSYATNFVPNDPQYWDIFLRDRIAGTTIRISEPKAGGQPSHSSYYSEISADGRFIGFSSEASNLVAGDTNARMDAFLYTVSTGEMTLLSQNPLTLEIGNDETWLTSITSDGRFVTLQSDATNLVPGDTNGVADSFVLDRDSGSLERVSVSSTGIEGNSSSFAPSVSDDGRYTVFFSYASNLTPPDTNAFPDIFLRDRHAGITRRLTVDNQWSQANGYSQSPAISSDGHFATFASRASNLIPLSWGTLDWECLVVARDRVDPVEFSYNAGFQFSGNLYSFFGSDDVRLESRPGPVFSTTLSPLQMVVTTRSPLREPSLIEIHIEGSCTSGNIRRTVSIHNDSTGQYELLDTRMATISDSVTTFVLDQNPERYIDSFGRVRVLLTFKAQGPVFAYPWRARIDRMYWRFE